MANRDEHQTRLYIHTIRENTNRIIIEINPTFNPIWFLNDIKRGFNILSCETKMEINDTHKTVELMVEPNDVKNLRTFLEGTRRNQNQEEEGYRISVRVPVRQTVEETIAKFRSHGLMEAARPIQTGIAKYGQPLYLVLIKYQHKQYAREALEDPALKQYGARWASLQPIKLINGREKTECPSCRLSLLAMDFRDHELVCEGNTRTPMTRSEEIDFCLRSRYREHSLGKQEAPDSVSTDEEDAESYVTAVDQYDQTVFDYYDEGENAYLAMERLKVEE